MSMRGRWRVGVVDETLTPPQRARARLMAVCELSEEQAYLYAETVLDALTAPGSREVAAAIDVLREALPGVGDVVVLEHIVVQLLAVMLGRG
jgi:hypothetical protein